jgi:hypothetical protein
MVSSRPGDCLSRHAQETAEEIPAQYRAAVLGLNAQDRAAALNLARLVLTEMLHEKLKHEPMGIHILKNEEWKL